MKGYLVTVEKWGIVTFCKLYKNANAARRVYEHQREIASLPVLVTMKTMGV